MIYGSQIKFTNTFISSQRQKLENKSKCEVIMKSGEAGSEQALMVKINCKNNPVGFSGVKR